jgi:hypothetical protein
MITASIDNLNGFFDSVERQDDVDFSSLFGTMRNFSEIVLWGGGRLGTDMCARLLHKGIPIYAIWDVQAKTPMEETFGIPVVRPYNSEISRERAAVVICIGSAAALDVTEDLRKNGFRNIIDGKRLMATVNNPAYDDAGQKVFQRFRNSDLFKFQTSDGKKLTIPERYHGRTFLLTDGRVDSSLVRAFGYPITSLEGFTDEEIRESFFLVCFEVDSDGLPVLRRIIAAGGKFLPHIDPTWRKNSYRFVNRYANWAMQRTWQKADRLSHLIPIVHENICEAIELTRNVPGDYVEVGVYLGGSACTALNYLDAIGSKNRKAWLLDTFDGFNYLEANESPDALWVGTHGLLGGPGTIAFIKETLADIDCEFELVETNICTKPLPESIQLISVANIDVDMYEPTLAAYMKVAPLIQSGGIIIAEDPASTPGTYGALVAMHTFLESPAGRRFKAVFKMGQYFLIAS